MRFRTFVPLAAALLPLLAACGASNPVECVPIGGVYHGETPQLVLEYHSDLDVAAETDTLAARYGFTVVNEIPANHIALIAAPQPETVLNGLRCEPSIQAMWYNQPGGS